MFRRIKKLYILTPAVVAAILSSTVSADDVEKNPVTNNEQEYYLSTPMDIIDKNISVFENYFNDKFINKLAFYGNDASMKAKVITKDKQYIVTMEVPGFDKTQIKIKVIRNKLFISGKTERSKEEVNQTERRFNYSMHLHDDVDQDAISSTLKNGILYITLPRVELKGNDSKEIPIN